MSPPKPVGPKAQHEDKASSLMNLGGKGSAPRKALPRIDLSTLNSDVEEFITRIPIGGMPPNGPRSMEWQDIGTNYITGQILPGRRKSMEPMTKRIPDEDYQRLQQFITDSPWDPKCTMDATITFCRDEMSGPDGIFIGDDTGSRKQGKMSPGVARQYFSETGNVDNCQTTVTCLYASQIGPTNADLGTWPLGVGLYIPKEWDKDKIRREKAGIPPDVRHTEKWRILLNIIENARDLKVPHKCTIADESYGRVGDFRAQLREWKEAYILAVPLDKFKIVPGDTPILLPGSEGKHTGRKRTNPFLPEGIKAKSPRMIIGTMKAWTTVRWAEGTKGPLEAKFTRMKVRVCKRQTPTDEIGWLLMEDGPDGLKAFICWGLDDMRLEEQVSLAHCRWAIEEYHKQIKDRLGFDHFQGRTYPGWLHHAVLTQMTFALLAWLRWKQRSSDGEVALPTLPEVRRRLIKAIVERFLMDDTDTRHRVGGRCKRCPVKRLVLESG